MAWCLVKHRDNFNFTFSVKECRIPEAGSMLPTDNTNIGTELGAAPDRNTPPVM
jgi:hypothetical protein